VEKMKYRKFGRLGWEASVLGMGVMRLPGTTRGEAGTTPGDPGAAAGDPGAIDRTESIRLLRHGIDQGINYLDLGFPWDMDCHEPVLGVVREALAGGYREKVKLALTVPALLLSSPGDFDRHLDRQLEWLGFDSVDLGFLGRLTRDNWPALKTNGILDSLEKAQEDGRIGHAGFSFHDHYQILKSIVQAYDRWATCSVQYSFMDVDHDPGRSGISYAADSGLAVVVTEPFKEGRLTKQPPEEVLRIWEESGKRRSAAEWALRFVWNHPGVSVAVADMSSLEQLTENLRVAEEAEAGSLSVAEEVTISKVRDAYRKRRPVPCPSCRPCMPCPMGIDVPRFFEAYNDAVMYDDVELARVICSRERIYPGDCTECGLCESRCAKRLSMVALIAEGREFLGID
jgi:predicted aldo/keto reductase-like oxidoreductase